ncbi:LysR family transcriptional regulator [Massilia varians]|uniref:LysR family transcriptional regulator n=1 Tax=Massilia varians TaxID=457921 RepID=A0ABN6TID6_9BURK|nr:LysR substrate-binding domain-containing protein [Massilia varians]BDT60795.1 LysR family transcriptional regulator [Massilia varians]
MTLEQLRIFVAVAERQHLTQAAAALSLTPSAVSASIKALEERYGATLFHRVGRRIETSEEGRIFLEEARRTLASARAAETTLAELGELRRGALALHASQTIASYWLPSFLVRFRERYPAIGLELEVGNTQGVAQAVLQGLADLGFVEDAIDVPQLSAAAVGQDRMVVVVAPGHPWADGRALAPSDLREAQWILRETGSGTRSAFEAALARLGIPAASLRVALSLPSNEAVRSAVMAGPFATAMSEMVVASHLEAGLLKRARLALPVRDFLLLRHRTRHRSRAAAAFEDSVLASRPAPDSGQ